MCFYNGGEIQTETTQTFKHAELVRGQLSKVNTRAHTITLELGELDFNGNFEPDRDEDGDQWTQDIRLPEGMTVNPSHLGTYYELRVIDGVLDPTHKLD